MPASKVRLGSLKKCATGGVALSESAELTVLVFLVLHGLRSRVEKRVLDLVGRCRNRFGACVTGVALRDLLSRFEIRRSAPRLSRRALFAGVQALRRNKEDAGQQGEDDLVGRV
jgi:hypothetical protein